MPIDIKKEDVEQRLMREMREKQREAGYLDTYKNIPIKSKK
jgi:hypothetical protein